MSINRSANQILDQLDFVIEQLTVEEFNENLEVLSGTSIGQHVRHTLEFFICLMHAVKEGVVNYDNRRHDQMIEKDPVLARSVIKSIRYFLDKEQSDITLELEASYQVEADDSVKISSNFFRELAYNIEHAIHHMALIKIGVRTQFPNKELPDHFGVASSTVRYQKSK